MREKGWPRILGRWEPEKGGTRVGLGVVGFGKRVRTRLGGRRKSEEEGEREGRDTTGRDGGYGPWTRISSVPTVEKRRRGENGHAQSR